MKTIYVIVAAVLFTLSLVSVVLAEETGTYRGEIQSIDYNARTMTMKLFSPVVSPDVTGGVSGLTFRLDETSNIVKCDTQKNFQDIKAGEFVQINYHEKGDSYIAESVNIKSPFLACNLLEKNGN